VVRGIDGRSNSACGEDTESHRGEDLAYFFDEFRHWTKPATRKHGGTGLGMITKPLGWRDAGKNY